MTDPHGVDVAANGFPIDPVEVAADISSTAVGYQVAFIDEKRNDCDVQDMLRRVVRLSFRSYPFESGMWPGQFAGLTTPLDGNYIVEVGFREPLARTALGHELGHVFLGLCHDDPSEAHLADFTARYGLPY